MGVGVALDVSLGKSGRPSWSWCFSLSGYLKCFVQRSWRLQGAEMGMALPPGGQVCLAGRREVQQHLWGRRALAMNWEGLGPEAQRKPWAWSHRNLGLSPNPAAYFKFNHEATGPVLPLPSFFISKMRGANPHRPAPPALYYRRPRGWVCPAQCRPHSRDPVHTPCVRPVTR